MSFYDKASVGEIVLRKDECFWIFPIHDTSDQCSPCFSYLGEKWRFFTKSNYTFHLWRKVRSTLPKHMYTLQLQIKVRNTFFKREEFMQSRGDVDSDYGCQLQLNVSQNIVSHNGLVKLFFNIQRKDNIHNTTMRTYEDVEDDDEDEEYDEEYDDDEESENEENSEDDHLTDDSKPSNDENSKNKSGEPELKGVKRLAENFKQIFLDGLLSDVILKVQDREFNCHKVVLVARSPVFVSMFQHDLAEKKSNFVDIPDCTGESFEVFLHFLYCGSADTLSVTNVYNVYYAADKYRMDDLKEVCIKFMETNLSVETFCDIISLALRHAESKLLNTATLFFRKHIKKIIKIVQWQMFMAENPTQANELLIKALKA